MSLAQRRQNSSQVHYVVDLVILNEFGVFFVVGDIQGFILAGKVKLLLCHIGCYDILWAKLLAKSPNQGNTNLSLAASHENARLTPWDVFLLLLRFWSLC